MKILLNQASTDSSTTLEEDDPKGIIFQNMFSLHFFLSQLFDVGILLILY